MFCIKVRLTTFQLLHSAVSTFEMHSPTHAQIAPYVFPICGGRKVSHLKGNIEALSLRLSAEDIEEIDGAYSFEIGFPHALVTGKNMAARGPEDVVITNRLGHFDYVSGVQPILPE